MKALSAVAAILFAVSTAAFAQAPQGGGEAKPPAKKARFDCAQAKDPKACEERKAKAKAAVEKARKACEGKQGAEHVACMRHETCASAKDPAACEARAKEIQDKRDAVREACKDKKGDEYRACTREHARGMKK
jgi:hypothetical protein